MSKNYYKILGVSQNATKEEIRSKYIELVKKYHPDINSDADATSKAQEINIAYDILSDDLKRKKYDIEFNNNSNTADENYEQEPFNYEEEINNYTEREKKYAEKLAIEKVIKDELLKADSIIKARLEVIELSKEENMIEDYYFEKVEEFWDISNNYIINLENLVEKATANNLTYLITEINEKINIVNDNLECMPLTLLDALNYIENEDNKARVVKKVQIDLNNLYTFFNIKNNLYEQIITGFINEDNYDSYRYKKLYELKNILNNADNIKKISELYGLDRDYPDIKKIDEYIKKAEKSIAKLPKTYMEAMKRAEKYVYYNEKDKLISEVEKMIDDMRQMKTKMDSGIGKIITLKEMKDISSRYKILLTKYKGLSTKQKKLKIEENIPLEYQINVDRLDNAYEELTEYREKHLNEFFDVFTESTKRRTIGGLLLHDNRVFSEICLINATAATLNIVSKHYINPTIPSTIVLTSINAINLKKKYDIYKHNYTKGKMIINSDNDTKEEYNRYCLIRNIKNKSI